MLSTPEFVKFAKDVVLFCHLTTHIDGNPHENLFREKGGSMYPYMAFLDAEGHVLAVQTERSVDGFRKTLDGDVAAFRALCEQAAAGDADARRALFAKRVELRHFDDFDAAHAELAALAGLDDATRAKLDQQLVDQEFNLILGTARSAEDAPAAGARCLPMWQKHRIPSERFAPYFWFFLASDAVQQKDADRLAEAIGKLEATGSPRAETYLPALRQALAKLRAGG